MLTALTELLVPRRCGGCLTPVGALPVLVCADCRERIGALRLPDLGWTRPAPGVLAVAAFAYADPLAAAVKRAKAPGGHGLAPTLAWLLWSGLGMDPATLPAVRTWVPSVPRRARTRAVELPRVLAGPGAVALLGRRGAPPAQVSLGPRARRLAPHGTFTPLAAAPPAVVLVDDVRTTGATALAAAAALAAGGATRVLLVTLAVGGQDPVASVRRRRSPGSAGTAR